MALKLGRFGQQIRNTLKSFEMWCWGRMEKISWTDHVRNEEVLHRGIKERNVLRTVKAGRLSGLVKSCKGTACYNTLLKGI
jgi:hypothetical protein